MSDWLEAARVTLLTRLRNERARLHQRLEFERQRFEADPHWIFNRAVQRAHGAVDRARDAVDRIDRLYYATIGRGTRLDDPDRAP